MSTARSVFSMCRLSRRDARYPKYPTTPVLSCPGYEARNVDPPGA